ncbi:hypothetical protein BBJ28_00003848 [Nothophytophthora sp. Chile5]|nr:hypothetical protein BBJ28_00003848 [Nothophytophthora sp. Chile5]
MAINQLDRCYDICRNGPLVGFAWDDLPDNVQYRFFMDAECKGEYMTGAKVASGKVDLWGTPFFKEVSSFILMSTKKGTIKNGYGGTCFGWESAEWNATMSNVTRT